MLTLIEKLYGLLRVFLILRLYVLAHAKLKTRKIIFCEDLSIKMNKIILRGSSV